MLSNIPEGYTDEGVREGTEWKERAVYVCPNCESGIYAGERYLDAGDEKYCGDCLRIMSAEEIIGILGIPLDIAGYEADNYI